MTRDDTVGSKQTAAAFSDALAELKRRGSLLLVAGAAHDSLESACDHLMGGEEEQRRRLRVTTDAPRTATSGVDTTIHYQVDSRSATAAAGTATDAGPGMAVGPDAGPGVDAGELVTVDGDLRALYRAIDSATEEIEASTGSRALAPAELRLCLGSADAIVATHDHEPTFEFFHALSGLLREHRAMGHVHLPAAFDDETVQLLTPLFDAVVEVRSGGQQRWHLREPELTTDWLRV